MLVMAILKRTSTRVLVLLNLTAILPLFAQRATAPGGGVAPPKNLKILAADGDLIDAMQGFNEALGVQCAYCHVPGDFAADTNPRKEPARAMIALVRQLEPL